MILSEINIYPVKSLGGISLLESEIERRGLQHDRRYMLVDEKSEFITQRSDPGMAVIGVELGPLGIIVRSNGAEDLFVNFDDLVSKRIKVRVWDSICEAVVADDSVNDWFSGVLEKTCKLVYMPEDSEREINPNFQVDREIVSFADGYPLLLIGRNSLNELNERLETKLPMNRFRPNLVVDGSESYAEDGWNRIQIGDTIFRITKPCARCVVTTVDQDLGEIAGKEPLRSLAEFRRAIDVYPNSYADFGLDKTSVLFGQNLVAENFGGVLKVGDKVELL